ncbi:serine hydrolase [Muricauda sp. NFXS6]
MIDEYTAFSTASISKPFTATLFALLEERGAINLDVPVLNYLKRWRFPGVSSKEASKITLRRLLSHTAGTSQHGFVDYYFGDTIPTLPKA